MPRAPIIPATVAQNRPQPTHHLSWNINTLPADTTHPKPVENWTTRSLLDWMNKAFISKSFDSPRLCAEMLLAHVIGCDRMQLYTQADRPATPDERITLRSLVTRALQHEPIQYLVGEAWFFSHPFTVDRRVLIPRPSTETLLEHALQSLRDRPPANETRIADICTGSGCIAISALKVLPGATAVAIDISNDALDVARANAERHSVLDRITFIEGDLDGPLESEPPFHLILSNPPYIPDHEWDSVEPNVKDHEPTLALRSGPTGLELVRPLIERTPAQLVPGGRLSIEIAACTADEALALAQANPLLETPEIIKDLEGLPRVLTASRIG